MKATHVLNLSVLAVVLALPPARAQDSQPQEASRLGEHPAVVVARKGVHRDPTANFYLHPARLSWSLERPPSDDEQPAAERSRPQGASRLSEHPAVLVARRGVQPDPTAIFYLHPAVAPRGSSSKTDPHQIVIAHPARGTMLQN
jgi:hypothetical protein